MPKLRRWLQGGLATRPNPPAELEEILKLPAPLEARTHPIHRAAVARAEAALGEELRARGVWGSLWPWHIAVSEGGVLLLECWADLERPHREPWSREALSPVVTEYQGHPEVGRQQAALRQLGQADFAETWYAARQPGWYVRRLAALGSLVPVARPLQLRGVHAVASLLRAALPSWLRARLATTAGQGPDRLVRDPPGVAWQQAAWYPFLYALAEAERCVDGSGAPGIFYEAASGALEGLLLEPARARYEVTRVLRSAMPFSEIIVALCARHADLLARRRGEDL